jgi:hypothetical protein
MKPATKIKTTFNKYLDFVHDTYFSSDKDLQVLNEEGIIDSLNELNNSKRQNQQNSNGFKFSSLDMLISPLRSKFTFEEWSPYEIALFECCISKFNKNFDYFEKIVSFY